MTKYETLSLIVSTIAAALSFVALWRSRKTHTEFLELEKIHAELSRKQLQEYEDLENARRKAALQVRFIDNGDCWFLISNEGPGTATNIAFHIDDPGGYNPLLTADYKQKIPYQVLNAGENFTLSTFIPLSEAQNIYPVVLRWDNEDGSQGTLACSVSR